MRFPQHPDLRPRYLGQCKSRAAFAKMSNRVPNEHYRPISEPKPEISVDAVMRDMYKHIMEQIIAIGRKQTKKVDKTPKRLRQEEKKRQWKHDLRLAERFLGLRPGKIVLEGMLGSPTYYTATRTSANFAKNLVKMLHGMIYRHTMRQKTPIECSSPSTPID